MIPINAPVNVRPRRGGGGGIRQKNHARRAGIRQEMMSRRAVGARGWGIRQPYVVRGWGGGWALETLEHEVCLISPPLPGLPLPPGA